MHSPFLGSTSGPNLSFLCPSATTRAATCSLQLGLNTLLVSLLGHNTNPYPLPLRLHIFPVPWAALHPRIPLQPTMIPSHHD